MITRRLELPENVERRIQFASAAYKMNATDFIHAAIKAALECSAEDIPVLRTAYDLAPV